MQIHLDFGWNYKLNNFGSITFENVSFFMRNIGPIELKSDYRNATLVRMMDIN